LRRALTPAAGRSVPRRPAQGEDECGAGPLIAFAPDRAAVALDDLLADRQPQPAALVFAGAVQPLERLEDTPAVLLGDADAVVAHGEAPDIVRLGLCVDFDHRRGHFAVFQPVADQVLQ